MHKPTQVQTASGEWITLADETFYWVHPAGHPNTLDIAKYDDYMQKLTFSGDDDLFYVEDYVFIEPVAYPAGYGK